MLLFSRFEIIFDFKPWAIKKKCPDWAISKKCPVCLKATFWSILMGFKKAMSTFGQCEKAFTYHLEMQWLSSSVVSLWEPCPPVDPLVRSLCVEAPVFELSHLIKPNATLSMELRTRGCTRVVLVWSSGGMEVWVYGGLKVGVCGGLGVWKTHQSSDSSRDRASAWGSWPGCHTMDKLT